MDNEPAFPRDHRHLGHNGMTLRDWFAGQALAGLVGTTTVTGGTGVSNYAWLSYAMADAMLAERAKTK